MQAPSLIPARWIIRWSDAFAGPYLSAYAEEIAWREPLRFDIKGRLAVLLNSADGKGPGPDLGAGLMVPRDRIELPTRGFSILDALQNLHLMSMAWVNFVERWHPGGTRNRSARLA
jgi:hypothetical protein